MPESLAPRDSNNVFFCGGAPNAGFALPIVPKAPFELPKVAAPPKDACWPKIGADEPVVAPPMPPNGFDGGLLNPVWAIGDEAIWLPNTPPLWLPLKVADEPKAGAFDDAWANPPPKPEPKIEPPLCCGCALLASLKTDEFPKIEPPVGVFCWAVLAFCPNSVDADAACGVPNTDAFVFTEAFPKTDPPALLAFNEFPGVANENGFCSLLADGEPNIVASGFADPPRLKLPKPIEPPLPPNILLPDEGLAAVEEIAIDPNIDPAFDWGVVVAVTTFPKIVFCFDVSLIVGEVIAAFPNTEAVVTASLVDEDTDVLKIDATGVVVAAAALANALLVNMFVPVGSTVFGLQTFKLVKSDSAGGGALFVTLSGIEVIDVELGNPANEKLNEEAVSEVIGFGADTIAIGFAAENFVDGVLITGDIVAGVVPFNKPTTVGDDSEIGFGVIVVEADFANKLLAFADWPKIVSGAGDLATNGFDSTLFGGFVVKERAWFWPKTVFGASIVCGTGVDKIFSFWTCFVSLVAFTVMIGLSVLEMGVIVVFGKNDKELVPEFDPNEIVGLTISADFETSVVGIDAPNDNVPVFWKPKVGLGTVLAVVWVGLTEATWLIFVDFGEFGNTVFFSTICSDFGALCTTFWFGRILIGAEVVTGAFEMDCVEGIGALVFGFSKVISLIFLSRADILNEKILKYSKKCKFYKNYICFT